MKGESVFAADIETEQPKDNVVCESPWVPPPLSLQLSSFTKGSCVVVLFPTITSIIYDNETKRAVLCIKLLIRHKVSSFATMKSHDFVLTWMLFCLLWKVRTGSQQLGLLFRMIYLNFTEAVWRLIKWKTQVSIPISLFMVWCCRSCLQVLVACQSAQSLGLTFCEIHLFVFGVWLFCFLTLSWLIPLSSLCAKNDAQTSR